jgi:transposase
VRPSHESAGKVRTGKNHKIGNAHLRWAFGEAACLMLRELPAAESYVAKKEKQHGKAKAISILSARIARTAWLMLKRKEAFDVKQFIGS